MTPPAARRRTLAFATSAVASAVLCVGAAVLWMSGERGGGAVRELAEAPADTASAPEGGRPVPATPNAAARGAAVEITFPDAVGRSRVRVAKPRRADRWLLIDEDRGQLVREIEEPDAQDVACSPDGRRVLIARREPASAAGARPEPPPGLRRALRDCDAVLVTGDGSVATLRCENQPRLWDASGRAVERADVPMPFCSWLRATSRGSRVAAIDEHGGVAILDARDGSVVHIIGWDDSKRYRTGPPTKGDFFAAAVAFDPQGESVAVGWAGHCVEVRSVRGEIRWQFPWEDVEACSFSPDGTRLCLVTNERVALCRVPASTPSPRQPPSAGEVHTLALAVARSQTGIVWLGRRDVIVVHGDRRADAIDAATGCVTATLRLDDEIDDAGEWGASVWFLTRGGELRVHDPGTLALERIVLPAR